MLHTATTKLITTNASIPTPRHTLISYTVPWDDLPLLDFLNLGKDAPRVYWETNKSSLSVAGFGRAAVITANDGNRFHAVRRQVKNLFDNLIVITDSDIPPDVGPKLLGGFSFNAKPGQQGLWSAFPAANFVLPQVQLTRLDGRAWLTLNANLDRHDDRPALLSELRHQAEKLHNMSNAAQCREWQPVVPLSTTNLIPQATWCQMVSDATQRIKQGELEKVVLARARTMRFNRPPEPVDILTRLAQRYPDTYRFLLEPVPGHTFYGATPELLARVDGSAVRTVAMAGSIGRGATTAADADLAEQLMQNPKERHEHALVVDAIRENLGPLVTDLQIPCEPSLCKLSNIQHLETKIQGNIIDKNDILDIIQRLHPTPAVGGRPRHIALNIIKSVEPTPRGWYAAPVGWLGHRGDGEFAVAIRSAVSVGCESRLYAGAGIVADSIPDNEWRETELKFKPLAEALEGATLNGRSKS